MRLKEIHSISARKKEVRAEAEMVRDAGLMERAPKGDTEEVCPQSTRQPPVDPHRSLAAAPSGRRAAGRLEATD